MAEVHTTPTTAAWAEALAAYKAADAGLITDPATGMFTEAASDAHGEAHDRLLSTPAPNGAAIAYKIAVREGWTDDGEVAERFLRKAAQGNEDERVAYRLYLDALALAGERQPPREGDAELVAAVQAFEALRDRWIDLADNTVGGPNHAELDALTDAMDPHVQRSKVLHARTMAGLRAKAVFAAWQQPGEGTNEFDDHVWQVQRSLVLDVLALTGGAGNETGLPAVEAVDKRLVRFDEAARMEFEPEPIDAHLFNPSTIAATYLPTLRLAQATNSKTKAELIEVAREMGGASEDGASVTHLVEQMWAAQAFLRDALAIVEKAEGRLFIACSVLNPDADEDDDSNGEAA